MRAQLHYHRWRCAGGRRLGWSEQRKWRRGWQLASAGIRRHPHGAFGCGALVALGAVAAPGDLWTGNVNIALPQHLAQRLTLPAAERSIATGAPPVPARAGSHSLRSSAASSSSSDRIGGFAPEEHSIGLSTQLDGFA